MNADAKILQIMLSLRPALTTVNAPGALARFLAHMYVHGRMKIDEEDILKSRIAVAVNAGLGVLVERQSEQDWRLTDTGRAFVEANSLIIDVIQSEPSAPLVQPFSFMLSETPTEPARYSSVSAPTLDVTGPPAQALMEAYPDEDHAALKARILAEFASLRNMLIGHIPMTMEQLARLQALEHPKFQTWLQA